MRKATLLIAGWMVLGMLQPALGQDLMQGAAGIAWQVSIESLQGLKESARSGDIRYFRRAGDFYSIAGVTLDDVVYGFYKGRYFAAYMQVPTNAEFESIKSHLEQRYGNPRAQLRFDRTIYIWDYLDAKIKLKQYRNRPEAKLAFYYAPLSTQANQARGADNNVKVYQLDDLTPDYDF